MSLSRGRINVPDESGSTKAGDARERCAPTSDSPLPFPHTRPALLSGYFSPRSFSRDGERRQEESSGCSFLTSPYNATRESIRAPASSLFPSLSLSLSLFLVLFSISLSLSLTHTHTHTHTLVRLLALAPYARALTTLHALFFPFALSRSFSSHSLVHSRSLLPTRSLCQSPSGWATLAVRPHSAPRCLFSLPRALAHYSCSYTLLRTLLKSVTPSLPRYPQTLGRCMSVYVRPCPFSFSLSSPQAQTSNGAVGCSSSWRVGERNSTSTTMTALTTAAAAAAAAALTRGP